MGGKHLIRRPDWGGQRRLSGITDDWTARVTYMKVTECGGWVRYRQNTEKSEDRQWRSGLVTSNIWGFILLKCFMDSVTWGFFLEGKKVTIESRKPEEYNWQKGRVIRKLLHNVSGS